MPKKRYHLEFLVSGGTRACSQSGLLDDFDNGVRSNSAGVVFVVIRGSNPQPTKFPNQRRLYYLVVRDRRCLSLASSRREHMGRHSFWEPPTRYAHNHLLIKHLWNF